MHDEPPVDAVAFGHELLFRIRGVDEQHIRFALLAHGHSLTGTDGDCLDEVAGFFLKDGNQDVQEAGVLGACRGGQNDILLLRFGGMAGIDPADGQGQRQDNGAQGCK